MEENNYIQYINNLSARFVEWVLDHRPLVIIACLVLCLGAGLLATKLRTDFDYLLLCPSDGSVTEDHLNFLDEYGNDEFLYVLYRAEPDLFDQDILQKTKRLVEDLKDIPYVIKVYSITNLEFMEGEKDGGLKIFNPMEILPPGPLEGERIKSKLLDKPLIVNTFISEKGDYAALLCDIEAKPADDPDYQRKVSKHLLKVLEKPEYKAFTFYPAGNPLVGSTFYDMVEENITIFGSFSFVLITGLLILLFFQFKGVIGPFVVMQLGLLMVLAFMVLNDFPITSMFGIIPSIMMAIAIADAVHIISEYQIHLKAGHNNRAAIIEGVRLLGFPCLFTSLTTAIGFGSLGTSSMSIIRQLGISVAFGVLAAYFFTFTILIIVLSVGGKKSEQKLGGAKSNPVHLNIERLLVRIAHINIRHYKRIVVISILLGLVLVYGTTKIEVNASWLQQFGNKIKLFNDYRFIEKIMGGTGNFEIVLDSGKAEGVKTFAFVRTLEQIQDFAVSQDHLVRKTMSVADILKDVNCSINNNDKAFYKLPASDKGISQLMLLYELSGGEELEKYVSTDISKARLTIYMKLSDSMVYKKFHNELVELIESIKPADYTYITTGASYLTMSIFDNMAGTMVKSLSLAIIFISIMMIVVFRSFKIGLLSIVPNVFPVLFALGFMGFAGIWLSHGTAMVGCIAIGLAVDDTIHFISRYRMEFVRLGNYQKALEATMVGVGRALFITTIILVTGFGVNVASRMTSYVHTGMLTAICFAVALLADFFIAPAIILWYKPFGKETESEEKLAS